MLVTSSTHPQPGTKKSKIEAFHKAAQQGGKALEKHIEI
jgi:hypothetical protein